MNNIAYEIKGYIFDEHKTRKNETLFWTDGALSMIDHQKRWYENARKMGYKTGELDEEETIKANYRGHLTDEQLTAIINDGDLMRTPFDLLFPQKIKAYLNQNK